MSVPSPPSSESDVLKLAVNFTKSLPAPAEIESFAASAPVIESLPEPPVTVEPFAALVKVNERAAVIAEALIVETVAPSVDNVSF